ncbi:diphthamide synthase subunit DPH2 [Tubulinosema ratisbonensis]|uniref:Diphthamide synthase subunit DPH2 n=1 Tax=Tubulinosema ratisbonensis TaxID=291195 RepID=A0A437AQU5_9MICR|nr:diphthamide synthase subunit DPH2 [Tubulinosema ratisbonensis]
MYKINYEEIEEKIKNINNLIIIPHKDSMEETVLIYDFIEKINPNINKVIFSPTEIICKTKIYDEYDLLIVFSPLCYIHTPKNVIKIYKNEELILDDKKFYIFDSTFESILEKEVEKECKINVTEENKVEDLIVVTHSQQFYNYFSYIFNNTKPYFEKIKIFDKTDFLMKRICLFDKIKSQKRFGIFFTNVEFKEKADKLKNFLENRKKEVVLIYLKEVSLERLIAFEYLEIIVVIDCPFFIYFDYNSHIPVITPFELVQSFKKEWEGDFEINEFNFDNLDEEIIEKNEETRLVLPVKYNSVEYFREGMYDEDIHNGITGTPSNYKMKE